MLLLATPLVLSPIRDAQAQIGIDIGIGEAIVTAPPPLPVYEQPPMPADGTMWIPGSWSHDSNGYYWVPGTWVEPPSPGVYWTPGYWGLRDGLYVFSSGYWGPTVGYYGGINYGYGYDGSGYQGGEWHGREFSYNRSATNFGGVPVKNAYDRPIGGARPGLRPSFNGHGGEATQPSPQEQAASRQGRVPPTPQQMQHQQSAVQSQELRATVNGGHPAANTAATSRPRTVNGPLGGGQPQAHPAAAERPQAPPHEAGPQHQEAPRQEAPRQEAPRP